MAKGWDWIEEGERRRSKRDELADAWRQRDRYREAMYRENDRGAEAREVVHAVAKTLGLNLNTDVRGDDVWSRENMARVIEKADSVAYQLARHQGLHGSFTGQTPVPVRPVSSDLAARALATAIFA